MRTFSLTLALLALPALLSAAPAAAPAASPKARSGDSDVLATVNGRKLLKSEIKDRLWKRYGEAAMRELIDEMLVTQAAAAQKITADPKEVEARIKRVQSQFPDEAAMKRQLESSGTSFEELRKRIGEQVVLERLVSKAKDLKVSDSDIKQFFEANKERLGSPEAARVRHIIVAEEKEAKSAQASLKGGADFSALAKQLSLDKATADKGGDLGIISKGMIQPEVEKVVFALQPGQVSEPVKTPNGYHLFKVEELKAAKPAVFDEVKGDLKEALLGEKLNKALPEYLRELREKAKIEIK